MTYRSPTWYTWYGMKARCKYFSHPYFNRYGGRGITYDPRWELYENFVADMGERPVHLTLDRINNNKNYTKENCRWAEKCIQMVNRGANSNNTSGVPGVTWARDIQKWQARASFKKRRYLLYRGPSLEAAEAAMEVWHNETLLDLLETCGY